MSRLEEVTKRFLDLGVPTTSKFRNETKQNKVTVQRVSRLKKERKKKSKLLFLTEIALDFDPITGVETEEYNRDCKYRPAIATETMMKNLKALANENEATKKALLRRSGLDVSEWDTSDVDTLNQKDREVFYKHRYPSIYTVPACRVKMSTFTSTPYGRDYRVDVTRDPATGEVIGEEPILLQANRFFSMIAREEYNKIVEENKVTKERTEEDLKEVYRKIKDRTVLVSSDKPLNYAIAIEIPLTAKTDIAPETVLTGWGKEEFLKHMVLVSISSKIRQAFDYFADGTYHKANLYDNFYEIDMYCTDDEDKLELGKNTTFERAATPIADHNHYTNFNEALVEFLDDDNNLENIFQASNFIATFTPDLEPALCDAIYAKIPEDDPRLTEKVLTANKELASKIYPDSLFVKRDAGMLEEGTVNPEEMISEESALRAAAYGGLSGMSFDEEDEF